jgi:hypothetical protein
VSEVPIIYVRDDNADISLCISHDDLKVYPLTLAQVFRIALDLLIAHGRRVKTWSPDQP